MAKEVLISILVPAYNEKGNIAALVSEVKEFFSSVKWKGELVIIDDGSDDGTLQEAKKYAGENDFITVVSHKRNLGKTAAIRSGIKNSQGDLLVIFDADLQYTCEDIPKMLNKLNQGYDMVVGWKRGDYKKPVISTIYNFLCRRLFNVEVHDLNSIKLFRREVVDGISLRKGWHRYLAVIVAHKGYRIGEVNVKLRPRFKGEPKYTSPFRAVIGFFDLLSVKFQLSFSKKPMLLFGTLGLLLIGSGFFVGVYAIIRRIVNQGYRPLLYLVIFLAQIGISLFVLGFLAESISSLKAKVERLEEKFFEERED